MSEIIRISEQGKRQMIQLKRTTKIEQWNTLSRWALCKSLQDPTALREIEIGRMSNIEMTWETFCGPFQSLVAGLLYHRMNSVISEKTEFNDKTTLCIAHIHRGISSMSYEKPDIRRLVERTEL